MSPKLPTFKASEIIKLLEHNSFTNKMRSLNATTIIIPSHSGKNLKTGLLFKHS